MGEKTNQIVQLNNPFNIDDRSVYGVEIGSSAFKIMESIEYDVELYDMVVSRNNEIVDCDFIVEENDVIMFLTVPKGGGGGGKSILAMVAMIALAVSAPYLAGAMLGVTGGATIGAGLAIGGLSGALIVGANIGIMIIGGMVISSIFKPNIPGGGNGLQSFENSPTYGWNAGPNQLQQGTSIPILYGTAKIVPQYIGKYVITSDGKQYLALLMALGEGPFDSIKDIKINDDVASNFSSIEIEYRLGTNNQTLIPLWGDTWSTNSINKALVDASTWIEGRIIGDSATQLSIGIGAPYGLFYANDAGGLDTYTVNIDIEYRKVGGTWASLLNDPGYKNIRYLYVDKTQAVGAMPDTNGPFDKYKLLGSDPWDNVNQITEYMGEVATLPTGVSLSVVLWNGKQVWSYTSNESPLSYLAFSGKQNSPIRKSLSLFVTPGQYEIRMKYNTAPIKDSRHGSAVTFETIQEAIADDFIYPNTAILSVKALATDQLSGGIPRISCVASRTTGTYGSLDNPAWACLDLLMNTRYGAGVPLERIDFASFEAWATYCTAENFKVDIYLDQMLSLSESLRLIGGNGRGTVIQYGSTFTALVDKPNITPIQGFLFSMGNIIESSFNESFLPLKDRANIIEVSYYDKDEDYAKTSIEVSQGNYDLVANVNKTTIDLIGCVDRTQALRQAKYHLNQNRYLTITASWEASIDSIHCRVGDIVNVAHDVPQWGVSGRIVSASGATVVLDRDDISMATDKTYYVQISNANTDTQLYKKVLSNVGGTLTLETALEETIGEYSVYSFGEVNRHAKQMRILSITTSGDLKRKISAIEYNPNIYADTVTIDAPIVVSDFNVNSIVATDFIQLNKAGVIETVVHLSWIGSSLAYNVSYIENTIGASAVSVGAIRENFVEIAGLVDGRTYTFFINEASIVYTVLGKTVAPDPVSTISGSEKGNVFTITWSYPFKPIDFKEFLIYRDTTLIGPSTTNSFTTAVIPNIGSATFTVKPKDTTGNIGTGQTVTIPVETVPVVTSISGSIAKGVLTLNWSYSTKPSDFSHYVVRFGGGYVGDTVSETFIGTPKNHTAGSVNYAVHAVDTAGNESFATLIPVTVTTGTISAPTTSFAGNQLTLGWSISTSSYLIEKYTITNNGSVQTEATNSSLITANWLGSRNITISAYDTAGNVTTLIVPITISAPSTPVVSGAISITNGVEFSWTCTAGTTGIKEYSLNYNGNIIVTKDTFYFVPTTAQGSYTLQVTAIDNSGNLSTAGTKTVSIGVPSVSNITSVTSGRTLTLKWASSIGAFNIKDYKIEYLVGATPVVVYATMNEYSLTPSWVGDKTFTITPRDLAGNLGTSVQHTNTVVAPNAPLVTSTIVGKDLVLTIAQTARSFDLGPVEIAYDSVVVNSNSGNPVWTIPIFWDLTKTFTITSVDVLGNRSTATQSIVNIIEAQTTSLSTEVVDNNVLLKWLGVGGTLPIDYYEISKGSSFVGSTLVGVSKSTFTTLFESDAGTYTYWVCPVDTAGNKGVERGVVTSVSQPPDFILNVEWTSDWSGTKTNIKVDGTKGVLPVNLTETYEGHFTSRSWTTIQNQIDAGYPQWLSPTTGSATYIQTFDYGTLLGSTNITLTDPLITKFGAGTYSVTRQIAISTDGVSFTDQPVNVMQVFVTNIRYVKVTYTFTVSTNTVLEVENFNLRLDSKLKNDSGSGTSLSTDVGGTVVNFGIPFVDVNAISVTPNGTTPIIAIYDFTDVPNPTSFKVLLYNTSGTRVTGNFSWSARGY